MMKRINIKPAFKLKNALKKAFLSLCCFLSCTPCYCWGFFAHQKINYYAVFLLPPEMLVFYKPNIRFIASHAVDPDKRRYMVAAEGPRHFIDIDMYGKYPYPELPRKWDEAVNKFGADSLSKHGIVPWWIQTMLSRLTQAFREKNKALILKLSAELGHYIADAHVPLHACHNHNGQYTGQQGIHGFWESRLPELLADKEWDFFLGKAIYIRNPLDFTWKRVLESAAAADTVLLFERQLSASFPPNEKFAFENRNGVIVRQFASAYAYAYNRKLNGMVERRMQQAVYATASFWYTAWVNAGQPDLKQLSGQSFTEDEIAGFAELEKQWQKYKDRECE